MAILGSAILIRQGFDYPVGEYSDLQITDIVRMLGQ